MPASDRPRPLLWQLAISHYSEKVRWALDHKRVPHRRRTAMPGLHIPIALWRSGGATTTFPILELGDERLADSTAAIAALERRHPERPLYPADPGERRRAIELEEYFDEGLGPAVRLLPLHHLSSDPELLGEFASHAVPPPLSRARPLLAAYARVYSGARFGAADAAAAARAGAEILAAFDRIEAELSAGDGVHLVGGRFSVADLTAAALACLVVLPPGGPLPPDLPLPPALEGFRDQIRRRPAYRWVEDTYRRRRDRAAPTAR
ncbi:MAG TPA: glutathione S-transferase family protein [Solirubrobacterales bacterium]|nr:glutathione S-transferase family protein [Solirubrobacterales bacterium]